MADLITLHGGTAAAYTVDVSNVEQVQAAATRVQQELGDVTILINNAMVNCTDDILRIDMNQARKVLEVNVLAQILVSNLHYEGLNINHLGGSVMQIEKKSGGWQKNNNKKSELGQKRKKKRSTL